VRAKQREPVFDAPWEARAFALVVHLSRQGVFPWPEFQALLAERIARGSERGETYYESWLAAAETLIARKDVATLEALARARAAISARIAAEREASSPENPGPENFGPENPGPDKPGPESPGPESPGPESPWSQTAGSERP